MGIRPSAKAEYSLSVIPFSHDIVFADLDRLIQNKRKNSKEKSSKVKSFDGRVGGFFFQEKGASPERNTGKAR